jgi:hypothetical protein
MKQRKKPTTQLENYVQYVQYKQNASFMELRWMGYLPCQPKSAP